VEVAEQETVKMIPIDLLDPPIAILRTAEEYEKVDGIVESIEQTGQLQPILVAERNGRYIVVDGWRRVNAARKMGLKEIKAVTIPFINETEIKLATLASQIVHRDANPIKLAEEVKSLLDQEVPVERISKATGLSKEKIYILNEIAKLPAELKEKFAKHKLKYTHIYEIVKNQKLLANPEVFTDELLEKIAKTPTPHIGKILREVKSSVLAAKPTEDIDKLLEKAAKYAAEALEEARKKGMEKKIAWELAMDILNMYPVKIVCPWCGKKGDVEEFSVEGIA
jgi:ParB family chromosome partitioning protein